MTLHSNGFFYALQNTQPVFIPLIARSLKNLLGWKSVIYPYALAKKTRHEKVKVNLTTLNDKKEWADIPLFSKK